MIEKLKWIGICVAILIAGAVAWKMTGSLIVSGGVGGLIAAYLGWRRKPKDLSEDERQELIDQIDAGLEAKEAELGARRDAEQKAAEDRLVAADERLEEEANEPPGVDPADWARSPDDHKHRGS